MLTPRVVAAVPVPERLRPALGRTSYVIRTMPCVTPVSVGKKLTFMVRDLPGAIAVDLPEKPVWLNG